MTAAVHRNPLHPEAGGSEYGVETVARTLLQLAVPQPAIVATAAP